MGTELPVLAAILMTLSAVLSLITVIAIYREGGILKRLRATPLRPWMILTAHVLVKLTFTAITVILMIARGQALLSGGSADPGRQLWRRADPRHARNPVHRLPDREPRADGAIRAARRHAHSLPDDRPVRTVRAACRRCRRRCGPIARMLPLTYAVSLLSGVLKGESWTAHAGDVLALAAAFAILTVVSARVFRWE